MISTSMNTVDGTALLPAGPATGYVRIARALAMATHRSMLRTKKVDKVKNV